MRLIARKKPEFAWAAMAHNVSANNAIAFGAMNDQFSRAKSNGATTILAFEKMSRVVCRVMRRHAPVVGKRYTERHRITIILVRVLLLPT